MVKFFLKDTEQEVKIGNQLHVKVPMETPYGNGVYEVDTLVTQASLMQLCKDGIVEKREIPEAPKFPDVNPTLYKVYIRRLARRMGCSFEDATDFLDIVKETSLYAHNCLLVDLMAEVMNKDKKFDQYVFTVNFESGEPVKEVYNKNVNKPKFATLEDAKKAAILVAPFVIEYRHGRK